MLAEPVAGTARAEEAPQAAAALYSQYEATVVFADLRGFSAITSVYPAAVLIEVLNRCVGLMADAVARHGGAIDKFMGDAVMAVFREETGAPVHHARRALAAAVEMQVAMNLLREQHRGEGLPEIHLGIGVSTGTVLDGLIGSDLYRTRTLIGEEVNIAARIEALSLRGQVLMSEATYVHCQGFVDAGAPLEVHVKGRVQRLRIREVLGIPRLGKTVPRQDLRRSPRVPVELNVDYWRVLGKVVGLQRLRAVIRDMSYHGVRMELKRPLPLYAELKLAFDLPSVELQARDVFARVVSVHKHWGARCVVGVEFTSLGAEADGKIRQFVQLGLQRHPEDEAPDPALAGS